MVLLDVIQATELLGRDPTNMERVWIKYTAGMQDYHLYCVTVFLLMTFYVCANIPYLVLDHLKLPFFEKYRLQPGSYNPADSTWQCFKDVLSMMFTTILPLQLLSYPFFKVHDHNQRYLY